MHPLFEKADILSREAIGTPEPEPAELCRVSLLECASPLALSITHDFPSARGLAHSKTLRRYERFMGSFDLQDWTPIGAMNRRKTRQHLGLRRQSTAATALSHDQKLPHFRVPSINSGVALRFVTAVQICPSQRQVHEKNISTYYWFCRPSHGLLSKSLGGISRLILPGANQ